MKSRIESGAKRRAVAGGASAGGRRGCASVGREIERCECGWGYAVMVGREDGENAYLSENARGITRNPLTALLVDYKRACAECVAIMREDGNAEGMDFPPPEFPRVVFVRLSASVMGVA